MQEQQWPIIVAPVAIKSLIILAASNNTTMIFTSMMRFAEDVIMPFAQRQLSRSIGELVTRKISDNTVSFGSMIGFLPYPDVTHWSKFLGFESWLRGNGIDLSKYKHNLGKYGIANETSLDSSLGPEIGQNVDSDISPDMAVEDLLRIYNHEKLKYLSFFVGQKMLVHVVLADRNSRRLIFSGKPKEAEKSIEKKRNLLWTEVESLIKELQQFECIQSVSKGGFSLSPGLAPTFQVYIASMIENEYKLLARSGNKVQEPGDSKSVTLVRIGGKQVFRGGNGIADGPIDDANITSVMEAVHTRVGICLQILTCPKLLFLDEPTSGLDSSVSYHVMDHIIKLAQQDQGTVIASIHQPSSEVFEVFHNLCLLSSGQTVYFGYASAANELIISFLEWSVRQNAARNKSNVQHVPTISTEFRLARDWLT